VAPTAQKLKVCLIDVSGANLGMRDPQLEPLLRAVATFGAKENFGALMKLHTARCIMSLGQALERVTIEGDHSDPNTALLRNLIGYLIDLSPDAALEFVHRPRFLIWLTRLSSIAAETRLESKGPQKLTQHLSSLGPLLFNHREFFSHFQSAWSVIIPPGGWIGPIEGDWYLESKADHPLACRIRDDVLDNVTVADVQSKSSLTVEGLTRGVRAYVRSGKIEIFPASHVPEIRLVEANGVRNAFLAPSAVDRELGNAFALIQRVWPESLNEVEFLLRGILPIQVPGARWINASSWEAPLVAQLTVKEDVSPYFMAEAIIHELSHMKMDIVLNLFPIIDDDGAPKYTHPWRQDMRPISGVLYGAHAFVNVLSLYDRIRRSADGDQVVIDEHRRIAKDVCVSLATLETHAKFSSNGKQLFDIMRETYRVASERP
jgi:hypothetical protein